MAVESPARALPLSETPEPRLAVRGKVALWGGLDRAPRGQSGGTSWRS